MVENVIIESCNAEKSGGNGFVFDNTDTTCLKWFKANMNCFYGFDLSTSLLKDGDLDTTFGDNGIVTTSFPNSAIGNGVALQKDGKIVMPGRSSGDFSAARYNTDGSLDATFGTEGKITTKFIAISTGNTIALQKDGKIVIIGGAAGTDFALARYVVFKRGVAVHDCIAEENG